MPELSAEHMRASARVVEQVSLIGRRSRIISAEVAHQVGLQPAQVGVLLKTARVGEMRVADLAEQMLVDPSVISRQISYLENAGLLVRRPDPEDRRASLVSVSDAGRALAERVHGLHGEAISATLSDWTVEEIDEVGAALERLNTATEQAHRRPAEVTA